MQLQHDALFKNAFDVSQSNKTMNELTGFMSEETQKSLRWLHALSLFIFYKYTKEKLLHY